MKHNTTSQIFAAPLICLLLGSGGLVAALLFDGLVEQLAVAAVLSQLLPLGYGLVCRRLSVAANR